MAVLENHGRLFACVAILAAFTAFAACAPLPGHNDAVAGAASASSTAAARAPAVQPANKPVPAVTREDDPKGSRNIVVGGASSYRVTLRMTPPAQVCDAMAFVDGVRYGYASTWNGLVAASAAASEAGASAARRPVFEAPSAESMDGRYKLQWNAGTEPANACAAYGYQIGKVMGTHQAYVDARGTSR